jgi:hypothetical protein
MFWETQRRVHSARSEGQAHSRVSGFLSVASRAYERVPVQTIVVTIEERGRARLRMGRRGHKTVQPADQSSS